MAHLLLYPHQRQFDVTSNIYLKSTYTYPYHFTRSRSLVFSPVYVISHAGQLCSVVSGSSRFRSTIAIDNVIPGLMESFHSFSVKILPPLSSVILNLPASTQLLPAEFLKLNARKSTNPCNDLMSVSRSTKPAGSDIPPTCRTGEKNTSALYLARLSTEPANQS